MIEDKKPPSAVEVEEHILGAMILENESIPKVKEILIKSNRFFDKKNQLVYDAIVNLFESKEPVDTVTLYQELQKSGDIEKVGGATYLSKLSQDISSAANIEYHSRIILEKWILRNLIVISNEVSALAYSQREDVLDLLAMSEKKFFEIMHSLVVSDIKSVKELTDETIELIDKIRSGTHQISCVKSGLIDYDNKYGGFYGGELTIIAARPSIGKSTLALSIAKNAAFNTMTAIFSYEMPDYQLNNKLISSECGISSKDIRRGLIPNELSTKFARACRKISDLDIYINDRDPAVNEFKNCCRKLKREKKLGLIIADYLQLMPSEKEQNREREISIISKSLKSLSKELDVPVIALSQLNRACELRTNKRPMLADLRESGSIEQDADNVIFIHRPEFYDIEEFTDGAFKNKRTKGVAELIIAKSRDGETGSILVGFNPQESRFFDHTDLEEPIEFYNNN